MTKETLLCIDLIARMQRGSLKVGEPHQGTLVMTEDQERVEFEETLSDAYMRNPKVFRGKYVNVHRDKLGHYPISWRKQELNRELDIARLVSGIKRELLTAQNLLAL